MKLLFLSAAALSLSACTITMKEETIFQPPSTAMASSVDEMYLDDQEELTSPDSPLVTDAKYVGLLPASIEHGYLYPETKSGPYSIIRASDAAQTEDRPMILLCYGTGADRRTYGTTYARNLLPYGDVIEFDYPGYGDNPGSPSIAGIEGMKPDVVALAEAEAGDRPLIYWGHSLGGFICPSYAASSPEVDAVAYWSTALNAEETSEVWKPWFLRVLPVKMEMSPDLATQDGQDNAAWIEDFDGPVLVISGGKDDVLPAWLQESLRDELISQGNDVTYLSLPNANHVNALSQPEFPELIAPWVSDVKAFAADQ
ncbi:MAG: alpha/beta hydrolase [Ponticaulis sp.]|nr:alpha/beta hydrolase [Ponticaulis sp.]